MRHAGWGEACCDSRQWRFCRSTNTSPKMKVTIFRGASTSCRCQLHVRSRRHKRESRTSTKSDLPLSTLLSSSFGLRGIGCSVVLKSLFDSSKNGSDFLFLVWRFALCNPVESRPDERELDSCLTILWSSRFASSLSTRYYHRRRLDCFDFKNIPDVECRHCEEVDCAGSRRLQDPRKPRVSESQLPQRPESSASFYT